MGLGLLDFVVNSLERNEISSDTVPAASPATPQAPATLPAHYTLIDSVILPSASPPGKDSGRFERDVSRLSATHTASLAVRPEVNRITMDVCIFFRYQHPRTEIVCRKAMDSHRSATRCVRSLFLQVPQPVQLRLLCH
jgi:hypothetical protein